jgi:hypothetical protein
VLLDHGRPCDVNIQIEWSPGEIHDTQKDYIKETLSLVLELLERKKGRIVNDMDIPGFR